MSMIGEYVRLTPTELDHALRDPHWAEEFVTTLLEAECDTRPETARARCHDINKTWHALDFLLRRRDFPVDLVHGEGIIPGATDWGYGPPRYLAPERVRVAAAALAVTPGTVLVDGVVPQDLAEAEVYPSIVWARGESLEHITDHYEALSAFIHAAAGDGHAVVCWIG